jgi:hypothetical protein
MARGDSPPFARGETWSNSDPQVAAYAALYGDGGVNIQGKEYIFEPNSQDSETAFPSSNDPCGRPIHVKVVRNKSGINLKPGRLVHYKTDDANGYEVSVDGYCNALADRPAGIVDEFLPAAGVADDDLFYIVIEGPTLVTQPGTATSVVVGDRLVPAGGTGRTNDDSGRVTKADFTGSAATLAENIVNQVGFCASANDVNNAQYAAVVRFGGVA